MSYGKPTKRHSPRAAKRTPAQCAATAEHKKSAQMTAEERAAHAHSMRMALYAATGAILFAAAFIVLVLFLNQLPWR